MDNDTNIPDNSVDNGGGNNPAWNDFLSAIPEEHHEAVIPHLQNWDSGVQNKIQGVHSQYADYKTFLDNKINPNDLQMGYGLLKAVYDNPSEVINAIRQTFNLAAEAEQGTPDSEDDDFANLPDAVKAKLAQVDQLQNGFQTVNKMIQEQRQAELEKQEGEKLAVTMNELRTKYGEFDEEIILNLMLNGYEAEPAVKRYHQMVDAVLSQHNRPAPPRLLGAGGSAIPGNKPLDPRKLDSKGTKNLVAQMLEEAARQNRD